MADRYWLQTLGCPKNQVDSDKLVGTLTADGYEEATAPGDADLLRPARALLGWLSDQPAYRLLASGRDERITQGFGTRNARLKDGDQRADCGERKLKARPQ